MQLIALAAAQMFKRSMGQGFIPWLCAAVLFTTIMVAPSGAMGERLLSLAAILPVLFLLVGWFDSRGRRGILSLVGRTGGTRRIGFTEKALPAAGGAALCMALVPLIQWPVPWQFWVVTPLFSVSFTLLLTVVERWFRYPGRFILSGLWIMGVSYDGSASPALFTEYPGSVISTARTAGGTHPDTFILVSILLLAVSGALWFFLERSFGEG